MLTNLFNGTDFVINNKTPKTQTIAVLRTSLQYSG